MSEARPPRVLRGILRLGTFNSDGLAEFAATPQAFLNSLAPLLALPVVGGLILLVRGDLVEALVTVLANLVIVLAPPVAAQAMTRLWRREGLWLRYAVVYNWCQWAMVLALLPTLIVGGVLASAGLPGPAVAQLATLALAGYWMALNWFLARTTLNLSGGRAALFVFAWWLASLLLILVPMLVAGLVAGAPITGLPA